MASASAPDDDLALLDVGANCAQCGARDFLPFTCPDCARLFCGDHRLSHGRCETGQQRPAAAAAGGLAAAPALIITCPLCAKKVDVRPGESADRAHARHTSTRGGECTPRPQCDAQGCRARPPLTGRVRCSRCSAVLCLAHRLPEDHACTGLAREQQEQRRRQEVVASGGGGSSNGIGARLATTAKRARAAAAAAAASTRPAPRARGAVPPLRPSAVASPKINTTNSSNTVAGTAALRARALALPELCPVCPRAPQDVRFATVAELIEHCELRHGGVGGGVSGQGLGRRWRAALGGVGLGGREGRREGWGSGGRRGRDGGGGDNGCVIC